MKKYMQTALLVGFIVLTTATFGFAQFSAGPESAFPFFHLGCLMIGGLIIVSLKRKYDKLYLSEAIGSFAFTPFWWLFSRRRSLTPLKP